VGPAGTPAYAIVDPQTVSAGSPFPGQSSGFSGVSQPASTTGIYCLSGASGVSSTNSPATVSVESSYTTVGSAVPVAEYDAQPSDCASGQFEVKTFAYSVVTGTGTLAPSDAVAFTIIVP
jgi:hypothetical protein